MMIPNFPTDNLYKFLALAGLALGGFGHWASWSIGDSIRRDEEIARDQAIALIGDFEASLNRLASAVKGKTPIALRLAFPQTNENGEIEGFVRGEPGAQFVILRNGKKRDEYRNWLSHLDQFLLSSLPHNESADAEPEIHLEGQEKESRELRAQLRRHSLTVETLWHSSDSQEPIAHLACWAGWSGIAISLLGFVLWYVFVQRFQDKLVQLEVEKARKDLVE